MTVLTNTSTSSVQVDIESNVCVAYFFDGGFASQISGFDSEYIRL